MYLKRAIEKTLQKAGRQAKVVLLTGARQVGKSTVLQECFDYKYTTLDDENELNLAKNDRTLFFKDRELPLIIDEAQYAPELFGTIKLVVDREQRKGQLFLSGSQTYELMQSAAESLAGRICVIEMSGLSQREISGTGFDLPFIPTDEYISARGKSLKRYDNLWQRIHRGSMPELLDAERDWEWFYRDYVRTYLERDVRRIINVKDETRFRAFLVSLAARSGQIVVYEDIARDVGVDNKTVKSWLSVIAGSGLVRLINTCSNNVIKRMIKSPKLFFMDTGLLCYLVGWKTPQTAMNGAMSGNIFETFVVGEIIKSWQNYGRSPESIYYYRDKDKNEIDLVIEDENTLYPVEIKKAATIDQRWGKAFALLDKIPGKKRGKGAIICQCDKCLPLSEDITALPVEYI